MIIVDYMVRKDNKWVSEEKIFYNIDSAVRFCWSIKHKPKMCLNGWRTTSPEENQEMNFRVNLYKINGWRL